jgi:hypothetical protein
MGISRSVPLGEPSQHPQLAPVAFLLGIWEGEGQGLWPAEPQFRYLERIEMTHQGSPFVAYRQTTRTLDGTRSLHAESGYLRPGVEGTVEMVVAQPTGLVEVHSGGVSQQRLWLESLSLGRTPTALPVTKVIRKIEVSGSVLTYRVDMAMSDEPVSPHLAARLHRVS